MKDQSNYLQPQECNKFNRINVNNNFINKIYQYYEFMLGILKQFGQNISFRQTFKKYYKQISGNFYFPIGGHMLIH